ncbi:MAG: UDP-N-acetylmuramoyl-L-alanyl-D-glutamate--2,6-diaminopimelate ligase [Hyphomicrobiales bacterium]|nr:UDP-N-acetylmuramoyl-L-alanyl-D-glutamate--2,6-diaminopimelate ligase [Hyphomicrobiales bacterium]
MKLTDLVGPGASLAGTAGETGITGLTADSREVKPGYLFAALPGTAMDGADFIPQAIANGAAALLLPAESPAARSASLPVIEASDPRRALALAAARFYPAQPGVIAAVTGTNGKTSVVSFVRQIWHALGHAAASMGTVGLETPTGPRILHHTTPDPVGLHEALNELAGEGVTHLALEASSHGLQQRRLDGVRLSAAAFTNMSRDHLDYHAGFADYQAQKMRLFAEILPAGAPVVVDRDQLGSDAVLDVAKARSLPIFSVGRTGTLLTLAGVEREGDGQRLAIVADGKTHDIVLPLAGAFQSANALVAAGLCIACGASAGEVIPLLASLKGAPGRLERAGATAAGAPIFVDYAHTPDALATALDALRPYAPGRLLVVFGCGGDRDRGKRPQMGKIAAKHADVVYVTDDNPRNEEPGSIRADILSAAGGATEIGDRRAAIAEAIRALKSGDLLLVAGKGHETGQRVGEEVIPFSDHAVIAEILAQKE